MGTEIIIRQYTRIEKKARVIQEYILSKTFTECHSFVNFHLIKSALLGYNLMREESGVSNHGANPQE